jgi:hypothetical protein
MLLPSTKNPASKKKPGWLERLSILVAGDRAAVDDRAGIGVVRGVIGG